MAWVISLALALGVFVYPSSATALPILETFDTDTADVTDGSYSDFTLNVGTGSVSGGVLRLAGLPCFDNPPCVQRFTRPGVTGDVVTVEGQILADTAGSWNVGLQVGNRRFIFHPGFSTGAFQIQDAIEGSLNVLVGSLDMGFTPSSTAFHTMRLDWRSDLNELTVKVEDGDGLADPFLFVWTPDAGFDPTGDIGFTRAGSHSPGDGRFDNLAIVPEPSTALLVAAGLAGLRVMRRRRFSAPRRSRIARRPI
jgi:hypothetical protein